MSPIRTPDDPLPDHLARRPDRPWKWPLPTAWLLGTKLIGSLRDILLSSVAKTDLRTWMTAGEVIDLTRHTVDHGGEPCCFIDFLADTGDSQRLVYQIARLLKREQLEVKSWQGDQEVTEQLPRGSVLVIGGDTAYPIATHRRLLDRIRAPFKWAHDELPDSQRQALDDHPVSLLAVPGNHDYYDGLRGFEAMMHSPPVPTSPALTPAPAPPSEQALRLPGYKLEQHASYFATALPFGWQLWGLDVELREIDDRQVAFFHYARGWTPGAGPQQAAKPIDPPPEPPDRLILVTSRPAFVYQGESDHAKVIKASLKPLGLTPAFAAEGELEPARVRLDLSGDVHLYERYWGVDHPSMPDDVDEIYDARAAGKKLRADTRQYEPPERYRQAGEQAKVRRRGNDFTSRPEASPRANYASVVSGLGGAFHHPSQVRMGKTAPSTSWPSAERSAREIGVRLVDPYEMFRAGAVGIAGLAISMLCYFLVWSSDKRVNVLDVPFAIPSLSPALRDALRQLELVSAMVGIAVAMIGLPIGGYYLGRWFAGPIREMRAPKFWWQRLTRAVTHWAPVWRVLRLFGANPRSTWLFLTTILSWGGTLVGWWWLGGRFRTVGEQVVSESLVVVYVVITILVVGLGALGAFRAGQKNPLESWPINIVLRFGLFAFGAFIAFLVLWTPYAWTRLVCGNPLVGGIGLVVIVLTMFVRFGSWVFPHGLMARRVATWLGFALLLVGATLLPWCCAAMRGVPSPPSQLHWMAMHGLVAVLGAYFACLWVGWYFCISLQWNRHGNEAGSAARVTAFGEFLRIKLTKDKAEVWTISVEEHLDPKPPWHARLFRRRATLVDPVPTARLIDHFTVER